MTVTKKISKAKAAERCTEKHREGCIVSGLAVVADATAPQSDKCRGNVQGLHHCRSMTWLADGIVRDALADVRFKIATSVA